MSDKNCVTINVNIDIPIAALQAIVTNAKKMTGPDKKGVYHVDTADKTSEMINHFLLKHDFQAFVENIDNF